MSHNWSATMIGPENNHSAPLLRTEFDLADGHGLVTAARWLVSAMGVFEAHLGGAPVSTDVLSPGWSSYEWRLRYRDYDVTTQLQEVSGPVVLGLALGNGWYHGRLGWSGATHIYGNDLGAIAELEITYADGHRQVVPTDESWTSGPSAVLENDLYNGQTIDARLASTDWLQPGFSDPGWAGVRSLEYDTTKLVPYIGPPVVRHEEIAPVGIWTSPSGQTLVDFGQNLVGWLKVSVRGEAGQTVTIRHAEVLEHGELGVRPLRKANQTDRFILSGGDDIFEPTFTFHGFRYAEVSGWPGELTPADLVAVVVSSDLARIGEFACSDPMLNQLHVNVVWGQRGNFLDVPTDCPQRDERLGWTGDIAVFAPTAAFLFDVEGFLHDWLVDLDAEQAAADGLVPFVVPDVLKHAGQSTSFPDPDSTAVWSDAAVWVPWALWQAYGDRDVLAGTYPAMTAHLRRVETLLSPEGLWDSSFQFGDWLDPDAPPDKPAQAKADKGVVATACLYRSASTVAQVALLLGHDSDAEYFAGLAERTRVAFNKHYVDANGVVLSDCPTVYALAIVFGLLEEPHLAFAGDRLAELAAANGYRVSTGFAGTPYICDALTQTGHLDAAYRLLLERECPSWLYPVTMGATTIWERWDSMLPDGSINPGQMTSFNHYALGAVADWMHRVIGGIEPAAPGYERVRVAPRPGGGLTWAKASLRTAWGDLRVAWELVGDELTLDADIPEGVTAEIELPGSEPEVVPGGQRVTRTITSTVRSH
ncbi:MAG: GH78 / CBM67 [uncultured Propionibacteriaceae bacterium]|uniref:alpha-L-rhamnosidase n=1 Tax=uncultured Propionibacteriaceae bacterium TaxID=257457 RepID=A0A6J4NE21_9ACTN|nr:MAG: GH78 / CBM67 [uncultured Propionibacteriaceae bacterium]